MELYDNCISLGCFCGTAAAMEKHGLRSHSGPFDWYFSDFDSVLKVIETDFSDFMKKENLLISESNQKEFCDTKYGFRCGHDIHCNFEEEYPLIYEKYMRRAKQFMKDAQSPTCFIRTVKSNREIRFIKENKEYIYQVLRKGNADNEIIFLLRNGLAELPDDFCWFRLNIDQYIGKTYEMRYMFESSKLLLEYCQKILPPEDVERNRRFDRKHLKLRTKFSILAGKLRHEPLFSLLHAGNGQVDT